MTEKNTVPPEQTALGVFMLGLAVLAVFDFWFPGIFFAIAAAWLSFARAEGLAWGKVRGAWLLIAVGAIFWVRDVLRALELSDYFPIVMMVAGVAFAAGVDWRKFLHLTEDDKP